jgi:hypothetical protein
LANYFGPLFHGTLDAHWAIDVHAGIFLIWLLLFLGQAIIAYKKKIPEHITVGTYVGIPWGVLLLIVGLLITFAVILPDIGREPEPQILAVGLLGSLGDILTFGLFFVAAVWYRTKPDIHKRLMVLATVALLGAPIARLDIGFASFLTLRLLPLLVAMAYDKWLREKIHHVYWIGLAVLLLNVSRMFWARSRNMAKHCSLDNQTHETSYGDNF